MNHASYSDLLNIVREKYDVQQIYKFELSKHAIQKYIEDSLAEEIIKSQIHEGDTIKMDLDKTTQKLKVKIEKAENKRSRYHNQ